MSVHWIYVTIAWGAAAIVFATLTAMSLARYRTAKRQLARLETRR